MQAGSCLCRRGSRAIGRPTPQSRASCAWLVARDGLHGGRSSPVRWDRYPQLSKCLGEIPMKFTWLESLIQDLRYGARGFARNPIFTLTAVFAAALGIGASTAVFSVVDRILFRSLPYPDEDRLVSVGMMTPLDTNEVLFAGSYLDWRKNQTPFESITSFTAGVGDCDLTEMNPARLGCASVEANFLPTLGLSPIVGRNFADQEDRPNGSKVALISYALWQGRFARDP